MKISPILFSRVPFVASSWFDRCDYRWFLLINLSVPRFLDKKDRLTNTFQIFVFADWESVELVVGVLGKKDPLVQEIKKLRKYGSTKTTS